MYHATINTSAVANTFILTAGGGSVSGAVTYIAATMVATFTPSGPLHQDFLYRHDCHRGARHVRQCVGSQNPLGPVALKMEFAGTSSGVGDLDCSAIGFRKAALVFQEDSSHYCLKVNSGLFS